MSLQSLKNKTRAFQHGTDNSCTQISRGQRFEDEIMWIWLGKMTDKIGEAKWQLTRKRQTINGISLFFSTQNIACVAHVWRELEGGIEACENAMSASLSCPPDKYSRTLISLKTPATQGTQTGKNATNSKRNERLEAGEKNPVRAFIK